MNRRIRVDLRFLPLVRMMIRFAVFPLLLLLTTLANAADFPPPKSLEGIVRAPRNIQRTMRLLAESTPEHRNTVRVLFYGQSITEQGWWKLVADDLRARFPNANLVIENRALGGYASQLLVRTAETDLYPFQPDLLIFHVFGAHDKYEEIIRKTRERTCAEILIQNDHISAKDEWRVEEIDPAKITPKQWASFMNFKHLPAVAEKYGTALVDQRAVWKRYLTDNHLEAPALLKDGVHLNAQGEWLMAECVKGALRRDASLDPSPAEARVKTIVVGKDAAWHDGKLRVEFEGNRVDVICKAGSAAPAAVRIDGRKPSEFSELYGFTRAQARPGGKWPPVAPIGSEAPLIVEDWTMEVRKDAADAKLFTFALTGSKTGADGEGRSDQRFVSKSGRIVLEPDAWNVDYALGVLAGLKQVPPQFTVRWSVTPFFVDDFVSSGVNDSSTETTVTLAQGLPNTKHVLEISGDETTPIAGLRIYCPAASK